MFDHLFAVAEGSCIYTGAPYNLVPFLSEVDLKCPPRHNPSDYRKFCSSKGEKMIHINIF